MSGYYRYLGTQGVGGKDRVKVLSRIVPTQNFVLGKEQFWSLSQVDFEQENKLIETSPPLRPGIEYNNRGEGKRTWNLTGVFVDYEGLTAYDWLKRLQAVCSVTEPQIFAYPKLGADTVVVRKFTHSQTGEYRDTFEFTVSLEKHTPFGEVTVSKEPVQAPQVSSPEAPRTHKVVKGDCFWNLSLKYYGDPKKWKTIQEANKVHGNLIDPRKLQIGTVLKIP